MKVIHDHVYRREATARVTMEVYRDIDLTNKDIVEALNDLRAKALINEANQYATIGGAEVTARFFMIEENEWTALRQEPDHWAWREL